MFPKFSLTLQDVQRAVDPENDNRSAFCTPNLTKFDLSTGTLDFITRCSGSVNAWDQRVRFENWDTFITEEILEKNYNWNTLVQEHPEILTMDVRVHCTCPSYLYWGYAYITTQLDTQLVNEDRFPAIRNPDLSGVVCKHLSAVFNRFFL